MLCVTSRTVVEKKKEVETRTGLVTMVAVVLARRVTMEAREMMVLTVR